MGRRDFISLVSGAAVAWPLVARARQGAMPVIGFLQTIAPGATAHMTAAFHRGLKEVGYVKGQNIEVVYRCADGQYDRLPTLVADLVRRRVALSAPQFLSTHVAAPAHVGYWHGPEVPRASRYVRT